MNTIFIHVKENNFKLNEVVDRSISKMEEQQGLDYITKVLIPLSANNWNKRCMKKGYDEYVVTKEMISRNLIKIRHGKASPDDKTTSDTIRYKSDFLLPGNIKLKEPFIFEIYKQISDGKLMTTYTIPGEHDIHFIVGDTTD